MSNVTHRYTTDVNFLQIWKQAGNNSDIFMTQLHTLGEADAAEVGTVGGNYLEGGRAHGGPPVADIHLQSSAGELVFEDPFQILLSSGLLLDFAAKVGMSPEGGFLGHFTPQLADLHGTE